LSAATHPSDAPIIVWFRQDLRIADNPALAHAAQTGRPVIPVFILDDETPGVWKTGSASRWWLHYSLKSLNDDLTRLGTPLLLRRGNSAVILDQLVAETRAVGIVWNRCYEPFARDRDAIIKSELGNAGLDVKSFNGSLLVEPWTVQTKSDAPYRVFTPFWREARTQLTDVALAAAPRHLTAMASSPSGDCLNDWALQPSQPNWAEGFSETWEPGELGAHAALEHFLERRMKDYAEGRDRADLNITSTLSPHLHWGEISPAQIWTAVHASGDEDVSRDAQKFLSEIGWREFSYNLLFHFPTFPTDNHQVRFDDFPWQGTETQFKAWTRGRTGYPFVDAGMRQLWKTGWMHNRVRMVAASFLIKHLMIDWRRGQDWFWDTLVDADLASNSASWQWVAGSGADAAPYFRIFNPTTQGEKFDPKGAYIRKWVPELAKLPTKWIHAPHTAPAEVLAAANVSLDESYPRPIVDHKHARDRALSAFKNLKAAA
jgi:deoxyribodipyrimidine photo-lyase